jgi:hypothetical protein
MTLSPKFVLHLFGRKSQCMKDQLLCKRACLPLAAKALVQNLHYISGRRMTNRYFWERFFDEDVETDLR